MCIELVLGSTRPFDEARRDTGPVSVELSPSDRSDHLGILARPYGAVITTRGGHCCCDFNGTLPEGLEEIDLTEQERKAARDATALWGVLADMIREHDATGGVVLVACWSEDWDKKPVERGVVHVSSLAEIQLGNITSTPQRFELGGT
jgi:hypothetical protein